MLALQSLSIFIAAARSGSFTAAATAEHVPVATVSRAIANLEREYDCRLFNRTTRRMSLTAEGEQFLGWVVDAVECLQDAKARLGEHRKSLTGKLKVQVPAIFARYCLVERLPGFLDDNPDLLLDMHIGDEGGDPIEGGFDVVVHLGDAPMSGYICRTIGEIPVIFAASPAYLEAMGVPRTVAALREHRCVASRLASSRRPIIPWRLLDTDTGRIELHRPRGAAVFSGQIDLTLEAALAGLGILPVAMLAARSHLESGALKVVLPQHRYAAAGQLRTIYPHRDHVPYKVRAFTDFVAGVAQATLGADGFDPVAFSA